MELLNLDKRNNWAVSLLVFYPKFVMFTLLFQKMIYFTHTHSILWLNPIDIYSFKGLATLFSMCFQLSSSLSCELSSSVCFLAHSALEKKELEIRLEQILWVAINWIFVSLQNVYVEILTPS